MIRHKFLYEWNIFNKFYKTQILTQIHVFVNRLVETKSQGSYYSISLQTIVTQMLKKVFEDHIEFKTEKWKTRFFKNR